MKKAGILNNIVWKKLNIENFYFIYEVFFNKKKLKQIEYKLYISQFYLFNKTLVELYFL